MCACAEVRGQAAALVCGESNGVGDIGSEFGGLQEEAGSRKVIRREALAEEGGTEWLSVGGIRFHQGFELAGEVGHAQAKLFGEGAIGNGLPRSRKRCEAGFERAHSASSPWSATRATETTSSSAATEKTFTPPADRDRKLT
jgi:hypothetical protein